MPECRECLVCRSSDKEGRTVFLTYNETDGKIHEYSNNEIMHKIVDRQIVNAKLENTVVKITASKKCCQKSALRKKETPAFSKYRKVILPQRTVKCF